MGGLRWACSEDDLRVAIDEGQLVVHYQPEVDLRSGRVWGVEALVRWQHPERGLLPPREFLGVAVETGLVAPLGWWVLEEACRQAVAWRSSALAGADQAHVSVNFDAAQLADPEVAGRVRSVLADSGLAPEALVLEVTEHGVIDGPQAGERLREIKVLGVQTAIDDFGTGHASLTHLRRLPIDYVKIDRSFIDGMTSEPEDATIVAAMVRLARALGIDSVAEGVETEQQLVQLRLLGCDLGQGFHWARPMPPDEVEHWWSRWSPPAGFEEDTTIDVRDDDTDSASLDEVLAYIIHELRSPLTVIAGYTELALRCSDEQTTPLLEPVRRAAADLDRRISTLAAARDAGQGALRLQLDDVDLGELTSTLLGDLAPQLGPHDVAVAVEHHVTARADGARLAQAITNLVVNAAKFSPAHTPIEVTVAATGTMATISVRDHGPGIPEDRRSELFRRFARLGERGTGMGVGLHLVRSIARAHGGDALYAPAAGGGSCFTISMPALSVAVAGGHPG